MDIIDDFMIVNLALQGPIVSWYWWNKKLLYARLKFRSTMAYHIHGKPPCSQRYILATRSPNFYYLRRQHAGIQRSFKHRGSRCLPFYCDLKQKVKQVKDPPAHPHFLLREPPWLFALKPEHFQDAHLCTHRILVMTASSHTFPCLAYQLCHIEPKLSFYFMHYHY